MHARLPGIKVIPLNFNCTGCLTAAAKRNSNKFNRFNEACYRNDECFRRNPEPSTYLSTGVHALQRIPYSFGLVHVSEQFRAVLAKL